MFRLRKKADERQKVHILTPELWQKYTRMLKRRLSKHRYEHSLNVSYEAVRLAKLYGADEEKAELAGLLHDVAKETSGKEQMKLIKAMGYPVCPELMAAQKVWHAPAGAAYARLKLEIEDEDVLNAIRYHTTARAGMSLLEKIVYLADYTSAERAYSGVEDMRRLVDESLEAAMKYALRYEIANQATKGQAIIPDTFMAYNETVLSGDTK